MAGKRFWVAVLVGVAMLATGANAQKNELTGILGRTFVSDQGVKGISSFDTNLHFGDNLGFEVNYGRHLLDVGFASLTAEVPAVLDLKEKHLHLAVGGEPKGYRAFFVTPSVRANLFPGAGLSPWVSFGGGYGHFSESSTLEFGGTNPNTSTNVGVVQAGLGLDVRILHSLSLRGQVRDFYSGVPDLNVDTGKSRQHNFFAGGGVVWHF